MGTIETQILEAIKIYGIWLIIITALILINTCGTYSLLKTLIKLEKEKKNNRKIMLEKIEYTNKLLENILTKQSQDFVNTEFVNNIINKNMPVEKEENKVSTITNKFNQFKEWIKE